MVSEPQPYEETFTDNYAGECSASQAVASGRLTPNGLRAASVLASRYE